MLIPFDDLAFTFSSLGPSHYSWLTFKGKDCWLYILKALVSQNLAYCFPHAVPSAALALVPELPCSSPDSRDKIGLPHSTALCPLTYGK